MSRPRARPWRLLVGVLFLVAPPASTPQEIQRADFSVHLDPQFETLYATVLLTLRNSGHIPLEVLEFEFPPPLGAEASVLSAWDRDGELEWRSDAVEVGSPRELLVALRRPLRPGGKLVVGLRYELVLPDPSVEAPAVISARETRLASTGWYPLPVRSSTPLPRRLLLDVRLPKSWRIHSALCIKERAIGTTLRHFSLEMNPVQPDAELLRAHAPPQENSQKP